VKLADILQAKINDGSCAKYGADRKEELESMPDEMCGACNGTGQRDDEVIKGQCTKCKGEGKIRPFATWYHFEVENVQEFVNFLRDSGGFEIH
jgi:DnaJ-class molecular chaperone